MSTTATTSYNSITERAMLIALKISKWQARKHDKIVSREVAQKHGLADESLGQYRKQLIAKKALEEINQVASEARTLHYELTLPWSDEGFRIISTSNYLDYSKRMRELQVKWETALKNFLDVYPSYVEQAKIDLNGLFKQEDYPEVGTLMDKFSFEFDVEPLPESQNFKVKMIDSEVGRIKRDFEAKQDVKLAQTMKDPYRRLTEKIQIMSDKLKKYTRNEDEKVSGIFRDTLVSNLTDVLDLIPGLNITNDPDLNAFADRIRKELTQYTAEQLRESDELRETTFKSADQILEEMSEFI